MNNNPTNSEEVSIRLPAHVAASLILSGIGVRETWSVEQPSNGLLLGANPTVDPHSISCRSFEKAAIAPKPKRSSEAAQKPNDTARAPQVVDCSALGASDRHGFNMRKKPTNLLPVASNAEGPRRLDRKRLMQQIQEAKGAAATTPKSNTIRNMLSDGHTDCHYKCRECGLLYGEIFNGICPDCGTKRAYAYCDTICDEDERGSSSHENVLAPVVPQSNKKSNLGRPPIQFPPILLSRSPSVQTDFLSRPSWDSEVSYRKTPDYNVADRHTNAATNAPCPLESACSQETTFDCDTTTNKGAEPRTGQSTHNHILCTGPGNTGNNYSPKMPQMDDKDQGGLSDCLPVPSSFYDLKYDVRTHLRASPLNEAETGGAAQVPGKGENRNGLKVQQISDHPHLPTNRSRPPTLDEIFADTAAMTEPARDFEIRNQRRADLAAETNLNRHNHCEDAASEANDVYQKPAKEQCRAGPSPFANGSIHRNTREKNGWASVSYSNDFSPLGNVSRAATSINEVDDVSDDDRDAPVNNMDAHTGGWSTHEGSFNGWSAAIDHHAPPPAPSAWSIDHVIGTSLPVFGNENKPLYDAEMPSIPKSHTADDHDGWNSDCRSVSRDGSWGAASIGGKETRAKTPRAYPKSRNLHISYWVTVEIDEDVYQVPINAKHVSGPKKAAVKGMQSAWKWLDDKGLRGVVSLEDVFELSNCLINPQKAGHEDRGWCD